jgi:Rrf2 family cysteine metabolism transcriptional repressor
LVLSQKSQYAVRALLELAKRHGAGPVATAQVAEAQCIPVRFLENILSQLRLAGIVESVRGKEGGYRLSRAPQDVAVGEVLRVIQGPVSEVGCAEPAGGDTCPLRSGCVLLPMWEKAHRAMMDVYDGTSFQDLVDQQREADASHVLDYAI